MVEMLSTHNSSGLSLALLMFSTSQGGQKWGEERREHLCKALAGSGVVVPSLTRSTELGKQDLAERHRQWRQWWHRLSVLPRISYTKASPVGPFFNY